MRASLVDVCLLILFAYCCLFIFGQGSSGYVVARPAPAPAAAPARLRPGHHFVIAALSFKWHIYRISPTLAHSLAPSRSFSPEINAQLKETKMQTQLGTGSWRQAHSLLAVPQSA